MPMKRDMCLIFIGTLGYILNCAPPWLLSHYTTLKCLNISFHEKKNLILKKIYYFQSCPTVVHLGIPFSVDLPLSQNTNYISCTEEVTSVVLTVYLFCLIYMYIICVLWKI